MNNESHLEIIRQEQGWSMHAQWLNGDEHQQVIDCIRLIKECKFDEARNILEKDTKEPIKSLLLAKTYYLSGDFATAVKYLLAIAHDNNKDWRVLQLLGLSIAHLTDTPYLTDEHISEVLELPGVREALEENDKPKARLTPLNIGVALLKVAGDNAPYSGSKVYQHLGELMWEYGEKMDAIGTIKDVYSLTGSCEISEQLGDMACKVAERYKDEDDAVTTNSVISSTIQYFGNCLAVNPMSHKANFGVAACQLMTGETQASLGTLKRLVPSNCRSPSYSTSPQLWENICTALIKGQEHQKGLSLGEYIKRNNMYDPSNWKQAYNAAVRHVIAKDFITAYRHACAAVKLNEDNGMCVSLLAFIVSQLGDIDEACSLYLQALEKNAPLDMLMAGVEPMILSGRFDEGVRVFEHVASVCYHVRQHNKTNEDHLSLPLVGDKHEFKDEFIRLDKRFKSEGVNILDTIAKGPMCKICKGVGEAEMEE